MPHQWTSPKSCMPLPGEVVVAKVQVQHARFQLDYPVQRAKNRWCSAIDGTIVKEDVVSWRSPTLDELGYDESPLIEAPPETQTSASPLVTSSIRLRPDAQRKLQAVLDAAKAPPPPAPPVAEQALPEPGRRRTLSLPRNDRSAPVQARPVPRPTIPARPPMYRPHYEAAHRAHAEPRHCHRRDAHETEAQVVRTRYVPRTMQ